MDMGVSILYVEPNSTIQESTAKTLTKYATDELFLASDVLQAWKIFRQEQPDIIITEINIGEPNGLELARQAKSVNNKLPIIILTSSKKSAHILQAIDMHANAYILKSDQESQIPIKLKEIIISLQQQTQESLRQNIMHEITLSYDKIHMLFNSSMRAIFLSPKALQILHLNNPDEYKDGITSIDTLFEQKQGCFFPDTIDGSSWMIEIKELPSNKRVVAIRDKESEELHYYRIDLSYFEKTKHHIAILTDVTKMFKQQSQYKKRAFTDELTNMHNRAMLNETLPLYIHKVPADKGLAIIIIDIDHFKKMNDVHGHDIGDQVLRDLATVLKNQTRDTDLVARWGGEEFILVMYGESEDKFTAELDRLLDGVKCLVP